MTQTAPRDVTIVGALLRLAAAGLVVCVAAGAVGYLPTRAIAGNAGVTGMLVGLAITLVGAWAGLAATVPMFRLPPREQVSRILGGFMVRFTVTIALAVAAAFSGLVPPKPTVLWVAIAQLLVLGVDTTLLVRMLKQGGRMCP